MAVRTRYGVGSDHARLPKPDPARRIFDLVVTIVTPPLLFLVVIWGFELAVQA